MIQMRMETREWVASHQGAEADVMGRRTQRTVHTTCPFCDASAKLYLWSLAGSGKLCSCGALFVSGGRCQKMMEQSSDAHRRG